MLKLCFNNHSGLPNVRTGFTNAASRFSPRLVFLEALEDLDLLHAAKNRKLIVAEILLSWRRKLPFWTGLRPKSRRLRITRRKSCDYSNSCELSCRLPTAKEMSFPQLSNFCSCQIAARTQLFQSQSPIPPLSVPVFTRVPAFLWWLQ